MRLDNFLSKALNLTRSEATALIKKQQIYVNDKRIIKKDYFINELKDIIKLNDQVIDYREFIYIMMNKPKDVVCAVRDKVDKTVIDLLDPNTMHINDLFPVGRLDKDTEGLLILCNDGKLAHKITSPNHEVYKKYYVKTLNVISESDKMQFISGLDIRDGDNEIFHTKPAKMEILSSNECNVYICEGKFHQIKRMFEQLNNKVVYLKRLAYGSISLDETLELGQYRYLTDEEIIELKEQ